MAEPTIAIVTSCHRYGGYLQDWAKSILALRRKPDQVAIWCHGDLASDTEAGLRAVALLQAAGIPSRFHMHVERVDFGTARNGAVGMSATEWVLHLDADDMIMPHALDDWAELAPEADIVCFGYERCGDLKAGPRNRTKLYDSTQGPTTLAHPTPCSGVSPFRRAFWDRAPYATDLIGGWDTALWLGFAHLGARFVATRRPCFWYRQHADSVFNTRRLSGWLAQRAGADLQSRRRGDRGVSILVPRSRDDGPDRKAAWNWLVRRYRALFPDWELVEGFAAGCWVKGNAVRDALARAHGRILIIADADCVLPAEALREAVARVQAGAPWVIPHRTIYRLSLSQTSNWLTLDPSGWAKPPTADLDRVPYQGFAGGGVFVVPRGAYTAAGGIPCGFLGWGGEDEATGYILDTLLGKHERLDADLVHLYHARQPSWGIHLPHANRALWHRYRQARGNVESMWQLVRRPPERGPLTIAEQRRLQQDRRTQARAQLARR